VSWATTVVAPEATPAVTLCAVDVITSLLAAAATMVSVCVAEVSPVDAAVTVGLPVTVSLK
jgi:hypothetical protein